MIEEDFAYIRQNFLKKNEAAIAKVRTVIGGYEIIQNGRFYTEDNVSFSLNNLVHGEVYRSTSPWAILSWFKYNVLGERN